jgi:phosphomannomutase
MIANRGKSLSDIIDDFPKYHTIRKNIPVKKEWKDLEERLIRIGERRGMSLDFLDGIRLISEDLWALVRLSKTEHKIRVLVEGRDKEEAEKLLDEISEALT